ncbi:hypothetical protein [Bacillus infantis]|uniref:hypothetical protein n=1 Tax=Bacillus infantis TaxID=324767 RepID=UPI000B9C6B48|nr:hypothetical protein [Bacillus infantis]MCK6204158.1 hypothetical protein [Bacillus infantis]OXT17268.1 hypothetical protein B9K06_10680 [Bacillus sp. OG2]
MKTDLYLLPIPFFILDIDLKIVFASEAAEDRFPYCISFIQLADQDSLEKVFSMPEKKSGEMIEINLRTSGNAVELFNIYYSRIPEKKLIYVCCAPISSNLLEVQHHLAMLRNRLSSLQPAELKPRGLHNPLLFEVSSNAHEKLMAIEHKKKLKSISHSASESIDLINILQPLAIEHGKAEYLERIQKNLLNMMSAADSLID